MEKAIRIGGLFDNEKGKHQAGSIWDKEGLSPSIDTCGGGYREPLTMENVRIRRLTPRECWKLMGFTNEDFDKAKEVNSDTQLYKQAGNSIVVQVLESIFKNML